MENKNQPSNNEDVREDVIDDDKFVFIPDHDIRVIERVLNNWEIVKKELKLLNME